MLAERRKTMLKVKLSRRRMIFFALLSSTLLLWCSAYAGDMPIKIGVTMPLSGPLAFAGKRELNGIQLAAKKINSEGGILHGRKIELVVYDDKGNPEEAVTTMKKLIDQDKVVACIAGAISTPTLAQKEVSREAKMIHIVVTAQHPKITTEGHPYLFRHNSTIERGADALCNYVIEKLKPKTAWYLGINDDYGRFLAGRYKDNFEKAGIKLLGDEYYNRDDTDFMIHLTRGKGLKPEIIMLAAPSDAIASTILRQRIQLRFDAMVTQAMGILTHDLVKLAGKQASERVYSADSWLRSLDNPENKYFIDAYETEFKPMPANKEGAIAFECMTFLAQAMDKAKSATDSKKIEHIYRTTTFQGPRGKITFDKIGQALSTDYPIVVKDGEIILAQ